MKRLIEWCTNSETILWARLQVAFGFLFGAFLLVWGVVSQTDISPILKDPRWIAVWSIINGLITELLRRQNTVVTASNHLVAASVVDVQEK